MTNPKQFSAARLEEALRRTGLSHRAVADRVGVDRSYVTRWASGNRIPSSKNVLLLCKALDVMPSYLYGADSARERTVTTCHKGIPVRNTLVTDTPGTGFLVPVDVQSYSASRIPVFELNGRKLVALNHMQHELGVGQSRMSKIGLKIPSENKYEARIQTDGGPQTMLLVDEVGAAIAASQGESEESNAFLVFICRLFVKYRNGELAVASTPVVFTQAESLIGQKLDRLIELFEGQAGKSVATVSFKDRFKVTHGMVDRAQAREIIKARGLKKSAEYLYLRNGNVKAEGRFSTSLTLRTAHFCNQMGVRPLYVRLNNSNHEIYFESDHLKWVDVTKYKAGDCIDSYRQVMLDFKRGNLSLVVGGQNG